MEEPARQASHVRQRLRKRAALSIALCLLAALVITPALLLNKAPSPSPQTNEPQSVSAADNPADNRTMPGQPDTDGAAAKGHAGDAESNPDTSSYAPPEGHSPIEVISDGRDGIAAEHQAGVVLAKLPEGQTPDELERKLAGMGIPASTARDGKEFVSGWVELELADGVSVPNALTQLETCGVIESAQPNYIYRLIRGESSAFENPSAQLGDEETQPDSINGNNPPKVTGTGVQYDTNNYHQFVNDYRAKDEMVIITTMLREAYEYLHKKGYVSTTSYDEHVGHLSPETALTWTRDANWRRPTVAILDTGCDLEHEDLTNIIDHYDAVYPELWRGDIDGHGTHVAGIVSATTNNGVGITGVSLNAGLMAVNVFDTVDNDLGADSKDIARGYDYVIEHVQEHNVRVVNLSLGSTTESIDNDDRLFLESISNAYEEGILTVIASGNDANVKGGAYCDFPADFAPNAISVIDCAVTNVTPNAGQASEWLTLSRDSYSNYNMEGTLNKQVSALGSFVLSTIPGTGSSSHKAYESKNGTSMASPCVAGIAALLWQVDPNLTPEQVKSVLYSTADDVTENPPNQTSYVDEVGPGFDLYTGFGKVNAYRAVVAADTGMYLSIDDRGETSTPVLAKGVTGARTIGFVAPEDSEWTWTSDKPGVARVSESGLVTAEGPGQAIISASNGGDTLYTTVTVYQPAMNDIGSVAYGAKVTPSIDAPPGRATWKWTSSDTSVASIDEWSGAITGKTGGKTAVITATLLGNPDIKLIRNITVNRVNLGAASIELSTTRYVYNGQACTPTVKSVKLNGTELAQNTDYTISYENNVQPGTASVRITGVGNYTGNATTQFTIVRPEDPTPAPAPAPSSESASQGMFRLYNPNSGEHFYTSDASERDNLTEAGWSLEGEGWKAPTWSNTPVYRMYNPNAGEHHYTPDASERDGLIEAGWIYEGIGWYSDDAQTVPLYRDYNPNAFSNNHNYTVDVDEHDYLVWLGWREEGIAWYGM